VQHGTVCKEDRAPCVNGGKKFVQGKIERNIRPGSRMLGENTLLWTVF